MDQINFPQIMEETQTTLTIILKRYYLCVWNPIQRIYDAGGYGWL